jgi:hypothetical protein
MTAALACAQRASAQERSDSATQDPWTFRATVYGWFPDAHAKATFPVPGAGNVNVDARPDRYLSNLQFAFMGTLEARKGPWSITGDAIYVDFGKVRSDVTSIDTPAGSMPLPASANASLDLKAFVGAIEGGYAVVQTPTTTIDAVAGVRYLKAKGTLDYELADPFGNVVARGGVGRTRDSWDGVIGVRGKTDFAERWYVPYYADVGGGGSRFTWQAFTGLGYHFGWGDAMIGYRYLAYDSPGNRQISSLRFGGPIAGVGFRF